MSSPVQITKASILQIDAIRIEKYDQRWLIKQHYMFIDDELFFYLNQSGLLDKIVDTFDMEDRKKKNAIANNAQKRTYEDIDQDNETSSDSAAQRGEALGRKKRKGSNSNVSDASTQTESPLSMVSSSSSLPSVDHIPSTTIKTTVVQPVDAYAILNKKRYQRRLLSMYHMYLRISDISLLDDHGLLNQLVEFVENIDRTKNNSHCQSMSSKGLVESNAVHEKCGISEGQKDEEEDDDDEDDEDEDYEFQLTSEDEDEDDEQSNQSGCCTFLEEHEEQTFIPVNASTQTTDDLASNLLDIETNNTGKLIDYICICSISVSTFLF